MQLNAQFETIKGNIASLITLNSSNTTNIGKLLNLQEKYTLALKQSSKTLERFNILSQKSGYGLKDLSEIFQSFYSGVAREMNFKQSVKSFENSMQSLKIAGIATGQLKTTLDSLESATMKSSSDLGRFLHQLGLSNKVINEAKTKGELFNLIMNRI